MSVQVLHGSLRQGTTKLWSTGCVAAAGHRSGRLWSDTALMPSTSTSGPHGLAKPTAHARYISGMDSDLVVMAIALQNEGSGPASAWWSWESCSGASACTRWAYDTRPSLELMFHAKRACRVSMRVFHAKPVCRASMREYCVYWSVLYTLSLHFEYACVVNVTA